jgi:endonuclease/exonuclease/phosphatase family metal-dependent hydrolase
MLNLHNGLIISALMLMMTVGSGIAATASTNPAQPHVVVLSYNIRHGQGMDGKIDLERIAAIIKSVSPDIVSLQEVDKNTKRSHGIDQAKELGRLTGMESVYCASLPLQGGEYGNAILTKLPIKKTTRIPLPGEPRSALCVTVELADKASFTFIATHLDLSEKQRLASVPLIENLLASDSNAPAILAGDLNAQPESSTILALKKVWTNATDSKGFFSFPSKEPNEQIDFILFRPATCWRIVETKVLDEPIASDHRPILAVLEWSRK